MRQVLRVLVSRWRFAPEVAGQGSGAADRRETTTLGTKATSRAGLPAPQQDDISREEQEVQFG